jgi:glycerophosphoryl diester phosphodiesterase
MKKPLIIAHRGASGYAPENTMSAFSMALDMGSDGIELDVHLSSDGELVVCHDERVDRTTDGIGFIKDLTIKEIKRLDAGKWQSSEFLGQTIPTLGEVVELTEQSNTLINIEIKSGPIFYKDIEQKLVEFINKHNIKDRVIISSFNHFSLVAIKQIDSTVKTGALYMAGLYNPWEYAKIIKADAIHPFFVGITPHITKGCIENNIDINTFTVNDDKYMALVAQAGVSGIITDYPDRALKIVNQLLGV